MLFLRDLKQNLRDEVEADIRKSRPDLIPALEAGDDIEIGEIFHSKEYKVN